MADEFGVRTITCVSNVPRYSRCLIHAISSKKEKRILIVSKGDRFLYLIESGRHLNTFSFPSNILYFEVLKQTITVVTDDGKAYRTSITKRRNKKNKQSIDQVEWSSSSNKAHFSGHLSKETKTTKEDDTVSSVHISGILASQAILYEPRIQALFHLEESLISLGINDSCFVISYYASTHDGENNVFYNQTALKVPLDVPINLERDKTWPIPLLCYREKTDISTNILERKLFDVLVPNGKTGTPILLLGAPDGQVWTCNVKYEQTESEVIQDLSSHFKLLYHLEQSVVGLHLVWLPQHCLTNNSGTDNDSISAGVKSPVHNVVVMVGGKGKCVLVCQMQEICKFFEQNLAGPICCSSVISSKDSTCIIHSTGKEVWISKLSVSKNNMVEANNFSIILSSTYVCIPSVCCIHPLQNISVESFMKPITVVALTTKGKLLEITLPGSESKSSVGLFPKQPGLQLKELLVKIEKVAIQSNVLEKDLESIDKVLEHLHCVSMLIIKMARTLPTRNKSANSQPKQCIHWTVTPNNSSDSYVSTSNMHYAVKFKVINQSNVPLLSDWSVLLAIHKGSSVVSYSLPLEFFPPHSGKEFVVPLQDSIDLTHLVVVEAFLCCDISSLLSKLPFEIQHGLKDRNNSSLVISLGQNILDILSFAPLLTDSLGDNILKFSFPNQMLPLANLKSLCREKRNSGLTQGMLDSELYTVVVQLSKSTLSSITSMLRSTGSTIEASVLQCLFGDLSTCAPKKYIKTSGVMKMTSCCKLSVLVTSCSVKSTESDNGIDIVLKASKKYGLLFLLEAVITRLESVWVLSASTTSHAVRADELQRILNVIQTIKSQMAAC